MVPHRGSWLTSLLPHRVWSVENSADDLTRTINGTTVDVHKDNPAEELNYRKPSESSTPPLSVHHKDLH